MIKWRLTKALIMLQALVVVKWSASVGAPLLQEPLTAQYTIVRRNGTCGDWTSWTPPRTNPAIVIQAISIDYADVQRNFISLMEANSQFSRDNLYLMCLDEQAVELFRTMQIRCILVADVQGHQFQAIWKLRVHVVGCLLGAGFDVLVSDADALWVNDPMKDLESPGHENSSIVSARGPYPLPLGRKWGSTMCMGFTLFRASGMGMRVWQRAMRRIVGDVGDDQVALNNAADELGIVWDSESDMRFELSTGEGRGVVPGLTTAKGFDFTVTLLPHSRYTRKCSCTPLTNETVIAHCFSMKNGGAKILWMQESNLWKVGERNDV